MQKILPAILLVLAAAVAPSVPQASDARALLQIEASADAGGAPLTRDALMAFAQHELTTATEFTDGPATFTGPLARDVLAEAMRANPGATVAVMRASNDYAIDIPLSDFMQYDVIFALTMNGKAMSRRDKGPVWVMYPFGEHPELHAATYNNRLIWQLVNVTLR